MIEQPTPPSIPPLLVCHCLFRSHTIRVWAPVSASTFAAMPGAGWTSAFVSSAIALDGASSSVSSKLPAIYGKPQSFILISC